MIALKGGKILTVTHGVIENGVILMENGKITAVGAGVAIPSGADVIDISGCQVTPGLIDAHTHISTFGEPGVLTGHSDGNEMTGPTAQGVRAEDALNPFDAAIPIVRDAGFTTCCTLPGSGNIIGGTGIAFKLRGHTAEEMIIPGTRQMKMALGENPKRAYGQEKRMPMTRMGNAYVLRQKLFDAKVYSDKLREAETDPSKAPTPDFGLEALVPVVRGEMRCRIHSHRSDDILTAVKIAKEFGLKISIEHCTEGYKIADVLGKLNLTCVVGPLDMGMCKQEVWDCSVTNSAALEQAGVEVCLTADTNSNTKWLPSVAGYCVARGLSYDGALRGLTINPARLLGIDDKVGSIEAGKDADLVVWSGDPFCNYSLTKLIMIDGVVHKNAL